MCDKQASKPEGLRLEVGKTYINGEGWPVIIVHKGQGARPFLGVTCPGFPEERTTWYAEDGGVIGVSKLSLVREKLPTKKFRYKRYLWRSYEQGINIAIHREHGLTPSHTKFVKWIDEDWQTIEVEVP
jgi:hypothetical protein